MSRQCCTSKFKLQKAPDIASARIEVPYPSKLGKGDPNECIRKLSATI
jgi:hypothetical protein